ncbi:hypothetical protein SUGI_0993670 [Cryptomeria japonica]|nr:hypothetical protein SUGI_0993670 [Cryptomeria japonica]
MHSAPFGPPNLAAEVEEQCSQGHRASLQLRTSGGGSICLLCFSNLFTHSTSALTVHRAYAVSQMSRALEDTFFKNVLFESHRHFLVSPLSLAVCSASDQTLANDITNVITKLCTITVTNSTIDGNAGNVLVQDFIHHLLQYLASSALTWTPTLTYVLHCLGLLLELHCNSCNAVPNSLRNQKVFMSNLISGLHLPGDEIRGEILFVLYKLLNLEDGLKELLPFCPHLTHLAIEVLLKTESDELRTNCLAVLIIMARQEVFHISFANYNEEKDSPIETDSVTETAKYHESLIDGSFIRMFAEAVKGPLLSSDVQVQISALELIHYYTFQIEGVDTTKQLSILVEEGTSDYIFETLRVSENKESLVIWCIRILSLLSTTEQAFTRRFTVGFSTIIKVLRHVAGIALHPVQTDTLLLISAWLSNSPGIISAGQAEDLLLILTKMLNQHDIGDVGLPSEAFNAVCSAFIALLKTPSCHGIKGLVTNSIPAVLKNAISSACDGKHDENMLSSLYFFKEAFIFTLDTSNRGASDSEIMANLVNICESYLLPSVSRMSENEETTHALFQTFYFVLKDTSIDETKKLAEKMVISKWFSFSFECLAHFPFDDMRNDVFLILSLLIEQLAGNGMGEAVQEASCNLPFDPVDFLFLLGQISSYSSELLCSQSAIISILHTSHLYGDRIAEDNQVLASLEQCILVNASNFQCTATNHATLIQILDLYALIRDAHMNYPLSYSVEAEKILLRVIADCQCNILSSRVPKVVLRWFFQQYEIREFLMSQILSWCKSIYSAEKGAELGFQRDETLESLNNDYPHFDIAVLAELVEEEGCGTAVLVLLLNQMIDMHLEDDLRAVLYVLMNIIRVFPEASNWFYANGLLEALHRSYFATISSETTYSITMLVFDMLCSARFESLIEEDSWLAIANQVTRILIGKLKEKNSANHESVILFSLLSLILQKSKPEEGLLVESSRAIVLNNHLGITVEGIIKNACAKGPALAQLDERTSSGQIVISALVYHFFWLRSFHAVLQDNVHNRDFLFIDCFVSQNGQTSSSDILDNNDASPAINISSQHLCQLLYYGSSVIKLIASYSLAEVFSHISENRTDGYNAKRELKCSPDYLQSISIVLQGFILHDSICLAKNIASCIYWLLGCEYLNSQQEKAIRSSNWYRLVLEELMLSLATPNPLSHVMESCGNPKPAAYVAVALLRMSSPPAWVKSVFSPLCITSIIDNLSFQKPSAEIVLLFRSLLCCGYLEQSHIRKLHHLYQDCRRFAFGDNTQDQFHMNHTETLSYSVHNYNKIMVDLIMSASINPDTGVWTYKSEDEKEVKRELTILVAEIDKFLQESAMHVK